MLIAHRGFGQNRLIDFEKALKICLGVEFDIRLTKDKQIIIFHDSNFARFEAPEHFVKNLTYSEILELPFLKKHPEDIPPLLLETFLDKCVPYYQIMNVEIKAEKYDLEDFKIFHDALHKLRQHTKAEIIVSSFNKDVLWWITSLDHDAFKRGYLIASWLELDRELFNHFDYIHPYFESVIKKVNYGHYLGLNKPMMVWTFNYESEIKHVQSIYPPSLIHGYISNRLLKI
ncbi:glycerophosphoryl diester phosphodiesterase [Entomoplasma freundtii]|uniref:Glycerophosphoryl diester phosphodiesterase n=1 Tax=Entomoplasma freundtii TaxID=74700 RepID=A0A2K8NQU9_9MOLU|nr:glycerophosphodiester phosphodiesterase family protein [Entomoplasma freundtii]ATZ16212.1 glycerophosphoryl diester phosphodiesterase [Entomoplasma freundtii]TDY56887.1 glycerophosphoryl diester phosphodiesterase [Entomoplasma freundtii]